MIYHLQVILIVGIESAMVCQQVPDCVRFFRHLPMTAVLTAVKHCRPFVRTPQLLCVISHLLFSTFGTRLVNLCIFAKVFICQSLNCRAFLTQDGGKGGGFGFCGDRGRGSVLVKSPADITGQGPSFVSYGTIEEIATICAEDYRADSCHVTMSPYSLLFPRGRPRLGYCVAL